MGLDGIFLSSFVFRLEKFKGARVEKIVQPSSYEIVIVLKKHGITKKLLISASNSDSNIYFTEKKFNSCYKNFNFQELLKSRLRSAFLCDVFQNGLDRILYIKFSVKDCIGEERKFCLAVELIPRYSNIILYDENSLKIEDSIKRVSIDSFCYRPVLPKFPFVMLKGQTKLNIAKEDSLFIFKKIFETKGKTLSQAIVFVLQGVSVFVAKIFETGFSSKFVEDFDDDERAAVFDIISWLKDVVEKKKFEFCLIARDGKVKDYTYFDPSRFSKINFEVIKKFEDPSEMLDYFYEDRIFLERQKKREDSLLKLIKKEIYKIKNRIDVMEKDFEAAELKKDYKKYGDLICANIYKIKKGAESVEVEDFYDNGKIITLKLDPRYGPQKNVEIYYKLFKKSKTAKEKLKKLIYEAKEELKFLQSELGFINRASTEEELFDIALELEEKNYNFKYNYLKKKNMKNKNEDNFLKFCSSDGFYFYVGKNNKQNELLTLKTAKKDDMWLHVSDLSGSHVVILARKDKPFTDSTIFEAATVAAYYSEAREEKKVSVWYTLIKNVSKAKGLMPGTVIFKSCDSVVVSPNFEIVNSLKV